LREKLLTIDKTLKIKQIICVKLQGEWIRQAKLQGKKYEKKELKKSKIVITSFNILGNA